MHKSLVLQAELMDELGVCVFDVTLDCEDGAPVGGEADHAVMVVELAKAAKHRNPKARVAVRVHAVDHPAFEADMACIAGAAGQYLSHIMVPKVESVDDVRKAENVLMHAYSGPLPLIPPLHVLIESPAAVHRAFDIAAHPRVQSLSFGLMDFVSSHGGAIPADAMTHTWQVSHPLVVRAKLDMASSCHAHGKVPSHGVVTEFKDSAAIAVAAQLAAREFGYTRMWSIHPDQIRPILQAFSPTVDDIESANEIISRGASAAWAPVGVRGKLHDRASYRYYWQVLERAHQTGRSLPAEARAYF